MRRKTIWLLVAGAGLLLALGPAWSFAFQAGAGEEPAQQMPPGMMGPRGMMGPPDLEAELGLSDEQVTQLEALRSETSYETYRAWQKGRDTALDALNQAWTWGLLASGAPFSASWP